jgi:uncharacterized protein YwqG
VFVEADRSRLQRSTHPPVDPAGGPFPPSKLAVSVGLATLSGGDEAAPCHHLLGHPQLMQNDMRGECQLVTNGLYCGNESGYQDARAKALLETAAADWRLLLQIGTDEDGPGWMWGDCGRIYFWIRRQDLEERAFERSWLVLQCG